jgi:hypothetical protein
VHVGKVEASKGGDGDVLGAVPGEEVPGLIVGEKTGNRCRRRRWDDRRRRHGLDGRRNNGRGLDGRGIDRCFGRGLDALPVNDGRWHGRRRREGLGGAGTPGDDDGTHEGEGAVGTRQWHGSSLARRAGAGAGPERSRRIVQSHNPPCGAHVHVHNRAPQEVRMARKTKGTQPLPEELLDRSIGVLEGPVNRVVERVWKSRLVVLPLGLGFKVTTVLLGRLLKGAKPKKERR